MGTRILAFNTVTELCSVALMIDDVIYSHNVLAPKSHSERILPIIHRLLIDVGISLKSLDCIVFDQGPGSFIGSRIGISIAQGLSLGADLPLVSVSSLAVLAQRAWRLFSARNVITTIDARMNRLYWACYSRSLNDSLWICNNNACIVNEILVQEIISALVGKWVIIGTGWRFYKSLRFFIDQKDSIILQKTMLPLAQDMLSIGLDYWKRNIFSAPHQVQLTYLSFNYQVNKFIE